MKKVESDRFEARHISGGHNLAVKGESLEGIKEEITRQTQEPF